MSDWDQIIAALKPKDRPKDSITAAEFAAKLGISGSHAQAKLSQMVIRGSARRHSFRTSSGRQAYCYVLKGK